jgi:hypothetical protein
MPWVRLDEEFPDHPKVVTAGPLASWLHVCALAYCNRMMTDGFVPSSQVRRLVDFEGIIVVGPTTDGDVRDVPEVDAKALAETLVSVGMWERRQGGFVIHDYLKYQPSRAETEAQRKVKSEAGKAGGVRSGQSRRSRTEAKPKQTGSKAEAEHEAEHEAEWKQGGSRIEPNHEAKGQAKSKPVPGTGDLYRSSSSNRSVEPAVAEEEELGVVDQALLRIATDKLAKRFAKTDLEPITDQAGWLRATMASDREAFGFQMATMVAGGADVDLLVRTFNRQPARPASEPVPSREHVPCPLDEVWDEAAGEWRLVDRTSA